MNRLFKQSLGYSLISYAGILLSMLASIFLYPENLEVHGFLRSVLTFAEFSSQFFLLGSSLMVIRFFPIFRDDTHAHHGLLALGFRIIFVTFILGSLFYYFIGSSFFTDNILSKWLIYSLFLGFFLAIIQLLSRHISNYNQIALPSFFERFIPRIIIVSTFLLGGYYALLTYPGMLLYFISGYFVITILLLHYLSKYEPIRFSIDWDFFTKKKQKEIAIYNFFIFFSSWNYLLTFKLDTLMIPLFLDFEANSIYSICFSLGTLITIPYMAIYTFSSPKISSLLKTQQYPALANLFKQTSLLLFVFGLFFMANLFLGLDSFIDILPPKTAYPLQIGYGVILLVGLSSWIDISNGFNEQIIALSDHYKFNMLAGAILAGLNIFLNYYTLVVLQTGIIGPAIASLISMSIYNALKLVFIYKKYRFHPFSSKTLYILFIGIVCVTISYIIPSNDDALTNCLLKCSVFSGSFVLFNLAWLRKFYATLTTSFRI